jgi:hypothetical protein
MNYHPQRPGSKKSPLLGHRIRHNSSENKEDFQIYLLRKCGEKMYFILYDFEHRPSPHIDHPAAHLAIHHPWA